MHPSAEIDLAKLLGSIEPEAFFRDAWEKRHLAVRRNDPDYYHGLFSRSDVDSVIAFTRSRFVDPDRLRPRSFVQGWLPDDEPFTRYYPDLPAVHRAFAHGKTLILQQAAGRRGRRRRAFRRSLPLGLLSTGVSPPTLQEKFRELLQLLAHSANLKARSGP